MPNWCSNSVTFWHDDEKELQRLVAAYNSGGTMSTLWPCPADLRNTVSGCVGQPGSPEQIELEKKQAENITKHGAKDWYDWCCDNWGTKWDFGLEDGSNPAQVETDDRGRRCVRLGFDTAWGPPTGFYAYLENTAGFRVKAYYFEPGMGFCGIYANHNDRTFNITNFTQEWLGDNIPSSLCEAFNLFEAAAQQEEWFAEQNKKATDCQSDDA